MIRSANYKSLQAGQYSYDMQEVPGPILSSAQWWGYRLTLVLDLTTRGKLSCLLKEGVAFLIIYVIFITTEWCVLDIHKLDAKMTGVG